MADGLGLIAEGRRENQRTAAERLGADLDLELMSSRRQVERQLQAPAGDPRAFDLPAPDLRAIGGGHDAGAPLPAFQVHAPAEPCAKIAGGDVESDTRARALSRGNRGQERSTALKGQSAHL